MSLPHHRRYQWQFVWRPWRRALLLLLGTGILAFLIYMGEMYLLEQNQRLHAEIALSGLVLSTYKKDTFGAPGYVKNDWTESTVNIKVRKPR